MRKYSFLRGPLEASRRLGDVLSMVASEFGFNLYSLEFAFSSSEVRTMEYEPAPDRGHAPQARISARIHEGSTRNVEMCFTGVSDEVVRGIVERIEDLRGEK
jgi:hypothetical protein